MATASSSGSSAEPLLGSEWLATQTGPPPRTPGDLADLSPSLCEDASSFRQLLRQYRTLDDSITMRLNRASALQRSSLADPTSKREAGRECGQFWAGLVNNWTGREEVIRYCVGVMDAKVIAKTDSISPHPEGDERVGGQMERLQRQREIESAVYGDTLKRRMIHDELLVESIIRRRTFQTFLSRCPDSVFQRTGKDPPTELDPLPEPKRNWRY